MKSPIPSFLFSVCVAALVSSVVLPAAGAVRITEFLTSNAGLVDDEDGESPDWIEIHNSGPGDVNLGGWHLTDNSGDPLKWTFPATNLPAGARMIVFASGKNRTTPGKPLHTNFALGEGDYLGLIQPDGVTVATEFAPTYPEMRANVSYGLSPQATSLITSGAAGRLLVPTDGALGLSWTARTFNDAAWTLTNVPIGFNVGVTAAPVVAIDINERGQSPANTAAQTQSGFSSFIINSNVSTTAIQTQAVTRVFGGTTITISNASQYGYDDRLRSIPANTGAFTESLLLRDFIYCTDNVSTGGVDIAVSGLVANRAHRITIWSFDEVNPGDRISDWYANGALAYENYLFDGDVLPASNEEYRFNFDTLSDGTGKIVVSGRRDLATTGVAVFFNAMKVEALTPLAPTNTLAQSMLSNNATAYLRVPFNVADTNTLTALRLRMRYDDGFVAYINGQAVAARNAPGSPQWNSATTAPGTNSAAFEEFVIPNAPGLLVNGTNVLAIHGMNFSAADADFLIQPELEALNEGVFALRYFAPPTPGAENGAGYLGLVAEPGFSVARGFYSAPFTVAITSATVTASIYWTTNGSVPSPASGTLYTTPVPVNGTTLLRAGAFLTNYVSPPIVTHSYIFLDQVLQQSDVQPGYPTVWQGNYPADYGVDSNIVNHPTYGPTISNDLRAIPTLSIVMPHEDLWDPATGIYVDATQRGDFWERAASVELFNGNNVSQFQINCAIQMQGNASRFNDRLAKHSFQLLFKSAYGPSKLEYEWFPGQIAEFDNIILRACFTDAWGTRYSDQTLIPGGKGTRYRPEDSIYLRDIWMKDTLRDMGHLSGRNNFVHLYINGLYWGLYNPTERLDSSFFASHLGGLESDWDVIRDASEVFDGNKNDWNAMMALCNAGITNEATYQALQQMIDLDSLIDYMLLHIYAEAEDWPSHNWYAAHRRANPTNGLPATKWIFLAWDQEIVLDQLRTFERVNVSNNDTPARIYSQLRNWPEFRRQFGDRIQKFFYNGGMLSPTNNIARLQARATQIDRAIVGESARWGDAREFAISPNPGHGQTFNRDEWWLPELHKLYTNHFQTLNEKNLTRFRGANLFPSLGAPFFSQFGGAVGPGFTLVMTHTNLGGTIYYTLDGSDPRIYGSELVAPTAQVYDTPVPINQSLLVRARVREGTNWSALVEAAFTPPQDLTKLVVTEVLYGPPALGAIPANDLEFIELKNVGTNTLNLSGLIFSGITFTFPNGTLLNPDQFFVLARNAGAFTTKYPSNTYQGLYTGQLDNSGESISLAFPSGGNVFSLTYDDSAPWPVTPDGFGFSLVPKHPNAALSERATAWRASTFPGGSPGADDPVATDIAPIIISEAIAHTDLPQHDTIELFNPTATNVNVGGWYLSDNAGTPMKYRIPDPTIIPPGGYVQIDDTQFNVGGGSNVAFAFSSTGEEVYLFSGTNAQLTGYSHGFVFGASFNGVAFGRYVNSLGDEFFPQEISPTFGLPNSGPRVGPVVINEIQYRPSPGGSEFVELKNVSGATVPLYDPANPTNTWRFGGITFNFPTNVSLAAGAVVVIVPIDPGTFRTNYGVPLDVPVFGPFSGGLNNDGERLTLEAPDNPNAGVPPYVVMDEVFYSDKAPWPLAADGGGPSLQRLAGNIFGTEPTNWLATVPSPGGSFENADSDGDGLPNGWELANGTDWQSPDGNADPDGDGLNNLAEFNLGTNPQVAQNFHLGIESTPGDADAITLNFQKLPGVNFTIQRSLALTPVAWSNVFTLTSVTNTGPVSVTNAIAPHGAQFYRLLLQRP